MVENQTVCLLLSLGLSLYVWLTRARGTELAALTGMGDRNTPSLYPGRDTTAGRVSDRNLPSAGRAYDPREDDPIEPVASSLKSGSYSDNAAFVVTPSIQVLPEFSSLTRNTEPTQALTCLVVVELPGKRGSGHVPGPVIDPYASHNVPEPSSTVRRRHPSPVPPTVSSHDSQSSRDPPYAQTIQSQDASPFVAITEDLRNRIIDWKGHPLSGLGPLQMYDLLSVRRDALVREFYVYLFREAIICVAEEKKRSLGRFLSSASGAASTFTDGASMTSGVTSQSKGVLRLKGRIYIKHIRQVTDTSIQGELSLTIDMEDERLDSFILIFKDRSSLETWKANVQSLVSLLHGPKREPEHPPLDMEEFGGSAKAMRMLSGSTATSASTADSSLLHSSGRSTLSSYTSHGSVINHGFHSNATGKLTPLQEDETTSHFSSGPLYAPHMSAGPSNSLAPLPHPPMDLILVISLPPIHSSPSTAALKFRVIKASLDFVIASLGPRDRLSFVTFEVGLGGAVRKTPFLSLGRAQSRTRLSKYVDEIGYRPEEGQLFEDEFLVRGNKEEKTDVVTAVNHGMTLSG